jgi:DNA-directed RNA polymerase subunit RPC12/RpoP
MNDEMLDYLLATDSMDEFLGDKSRCPHCGNKLINIVYGMPTWKVGEKAKKGEIFLGGCTIYEGEMPKYHCNNCRRSYTKDLKRYIEEENNFEDEEEEY